MEDTQTYTLAWASLVIDDFVDKLNELFRTKFRVMNVALITNSEFEVLGYGARITNTSTWFGDFKVDGDISIDLKSEKQTLHFTAFEGPLDVVLVPDH